jgi:hypothetical protein
MIYKTSSINEVMARIIRNTRITDANLIDDLLEWIPEGMAQLETRYQLSLTSTMPALQIRGNVGKLPCDLHSIEAVVYKNNRLPYGSDVRDVTNRNTTNQTSQTLFITDTNVPNSEGFWKGENIVRVNNNTNDYYIIKPGYIQTSFEEGEVVIHYLAIPLDCDGFPLIPDNEVYKTALYWYSLMMILGTGYEHKVFKYSDCQQQWLYYQAKAINEVAYPSVDQMERLVNTMVRLIPAYGYHENFLNNLNNREQIYK